MQQNLLTFCILFIFTFPILAQETLTEQEKMLTAIKRAKKMPLKESQIYLDSLQTIVAEKFGERDSMMAKLLYRKGAEYFKKKKFDSAIELFHQVQDIQKEVYEEGHSDISKIEHGLGTAYGKLKQDEAAIKHYQNAIDLRRAYKSPILHRTYYQLGSLYIEKGDFGLAEKYLQLSIDSSPNPYAFGHHALGTLKGNIKKPKEAIFHLDSALVIYNNYPEHYKNTIITCHIAQGGIYDDMEKYEKALASYEKARILLENSETANLTTLHRLYNNLSVTYKKMNRDEEAIQLLLKSLELKKKEYQSPYHPAYTANFNNLGDVFKKQGKIEEALENYQKAIQNATYPVISDNINEKIQLDAISITGSKSEFLIALNSKVDGLQNWYKKTNDKQVLETALHTLETSCQLIDWMRQEQLEEVSKLFWRAQTRPVYEKAIAIAYQLQQPEKAWFFFEKSKAALLLDALKGETARRFLPTALAEREDDLQKKLTALERDLLTAENKEQQLSAIIKVREELKILAEEIAVKAPNYYAYKFETDIAPLTTIQEELAAEETTLLEYMLTEQHIFVLSISENTQLFRIDKPADFERQVQRFLKFISNKNALHSNKEYENYLQTAAQLYQILMASLDLNRQRLIIIPDGILNYIPFEALVKDATTNPATYLLKDYRISYAYSSSVLAQSKQVQRNSNGQVFALAPTEFPTSNLAPLNLSPSETAKILSIIKGQENIKEKASLVSFENEAAPYSILHLSTHASASDKTQQNPWIAFYDSLLLLPDIYHLNLNADLVVLSACETSKGNLETGEGVMSLARGFAFSGIASTVTSLWEVNERATSEIMEYFYQNLHQAQSKDQALHQAKLSYLEKHPDASPYFWAAFINIGNRAAFNNLKSPSLFNPWWLSGIGVFFIIGIFFIKKRKN